MKEGKASPPLVARMLAVYSTAVYDAVAVLTPSMQAVHAAPGARQPGATPSKPGMEAAISGAAYTVITALFPAAAISQPQLVAAQQAAYTTGVAAAQQVLEARSSDGFAAAPPQLQFPNPPMMTPAITTCNTTNIQFWQQLKVPLVAAFTPGVNTEFPPASYSLLTGPTQTKVRASGWTSLPSNLWLCYP